MVGLIPNKCPECGASVARQAQRCTYCGTWFKPQHLDVTPNNAEIKTVQHKLQITVFEKKIFFVGGLGIIVVYFFGWAVEDTNYWLRSEAVIVWTVVLPILLAILAFMWQATWGGVLLGFLVAITILVSHLVIMWLIRGRVNDDMVGIALGFAGAALFGWFVGRLLRHYLKKFHA